MYLYICTPEILNTNEYSKTCHQRPALLPRKSGLTRQVVTLKVAEIILHKRLQYHLTYVINLLKFHEHQLLKGYLIHGVL